MAHRNLSPLAVILLAAAAAGFFAAAALAAPAQKTVWLALGSIFTILAAAIGLFNTLLGPVDQPEPRIVTLEQPIKMIGVSTRTGMKTIFKDAARLGQEYKKIKDASLIEHKKEPWGFVAITRDFHGQASWEYLMGDVVDRLDHVPTGLQSFEIPPMTCAVFPIRPKSRFAWGFTIGLTKKYIYTEWLPKSKYEADQSVLGDFEYHDERSLAMKPEIDLYVAIRKKVK